MLCVLHFTRDTDFFFYKFPDYINIEISYGEYDVVHPNLAAWIPMSQSASIKGKVRQYAASRRFICILALSLSHRHIHNYYLPCLFILYSSCKSRVEISLPSFWDRETWRISCEKEGVFGAGSNRSRNREVPLFSKVCSLVCAKKLNREEIGFYRLYLSTIFLVVCRPMIPSSPPVFWLSPCEHSSRWIDFGSVALTSLHRESQM